MQSREVIQRSQSQSRRRQSELQPLLIDQQHYPDRRIFVNPAYRTPTVRSPGTATSLETPNSPFARQYYRKNDIVSSLQNSVVTGRSYSPAYQHHPRRHSSIYSPNGIASRMGHIAVSSPGVASISRSPLRRTRFNSITEQSRSILLAGIDEAKLEGVASVVAPVRQTAIPVTANVPSVAHGHSSNNAHQRLRYWGQAYLGNTATCDVFVRAVHLKRAGPSLTVSDDEDVTYKLTTSNKSLEEDPSGDANDDKSNNYVRGREIVVRARINPKSKDRKPLLIQRKFDLDELRVSTPNKSMIHQELEDTIAADSSQNLTRSKSLSFPRPIEALPDNAASSGKLSTSVAAEKRTMPIHNEYALHFLPVLAAIMLSGHVRKGDMIDLPLPHPEIWASTVAWVYTGQPVEISSAIAGNLTYLGGLF